MLSQFSSQSNQSTQSTRSHASPNPSSKNVLPNLHDALKLANLKLANRQFLIRFKEIESKEKSLYKAVRMIVAFLLAKESLQDEDVKILHRHFLKICTSKIEGQRKKLEKAKRKREDFHLQNIYILQTFADYIKQMLEAPLISDEFLLRMLSFIFRLKEVKGGIEGRRDVQEDKIRNSLEYLERIFSLKVEFGIQTENEKPGEKANLEGQKEVQKAEDISGELEGEVFVGNSIRESTDAHFQRMAIFLEQKQAQEIKYLQLCNALLRKI